MSKTSKILTILYIVFAVSSFFYIKSVMKKEDVEEEAYSKESVEEFYKVNAVLNYPNGTDVKKFKEVMENTDTVMSFLEELRTHKALIFEKTDYTYGTDIESVNNIIPPEGYKWAILRDGEDVTNIIGKIRVQKDVELELKMVQN